MRILLIHRYFWPDNAPYAQMLYRIALGLSDAGNAVSVLTTLPSHSWDSSIKVPYSEISNGVKIRRLPLLPEFGRKIFFRAVNTGIFTMQIFLYLLFCRTNVVMVASTPPVIIATIIRYVSKVKKFHYIYHCQDIHPEAMLLAKAINNGLFYRVLQRLDKKNVSEAIVTIVLSDDMKETLVKRGNRKNNIQVINNFIFDSIARGNQKDSIYREKFTILFAGNLGKFQGIEKIIDTAKLLNSRKDIVFIFVGNGILKSHLELQADELINKTVFFLGYKPLHETLEYMQCADIGVISLAPSVVKVAYPSKTMMYLSMGLPILVLAEQDSSLSRLTVQNQLGYVAPSVEPEAIRKTILLAVENRYKLRQDKSRIQRVANDLFSKDIIIDKWVNVYNEVKFQIL